MALTKVGKEGITGISNSSDATAITIDSSEQVGIGTASPSAVLDVRRGDADGKIAEFHTSTGYGIELGSSQTEAYIKAGTSQLLQVHTNGAERMRIDSVGTSTFNATAASNVAMIINNNGASGTPELMLMDTPSYSKDSTGGHFLKCDDSTATRMVIDLNGSLRNHDNSYGSLSDERIKQDIKDANSQWDDIKAVKVRKYKKKDDVAQYKDKAWEQIGVVAQELEASGMDKLVDIDNESEEKWKSVKYSVLYMKAIKALQEAMARIETLETKVKALEDG